MSEKDFVSFLVDETLRLQLTGEIELSSLDLKLKDYGLDYFKGEFLPQIQVLRFKTKIGYLDIPINWSIFSTNISQTDWKLIDSSSDTDSFFDVIKNMWGVPVTKLLITHSEGFCYLVGLRSGDESHLHDLLNPQEWLKSG